jgi:nitroimidazol reductase NimA-like FMN-containing flavoprotein (pyridoxamine 5'-phosphate oxidase superfamily)
MTSKQRAGKKASPPAEPTILASRPYSPGPGYGIPKSKRGLLPWQHVSERMAAARYYWISTVDPHGRPHVTPVDGLWLDDLLYFGGSPTTRRNRNLALNPATCVHLENGRDVVILHGDAHPLRAPEHTLAVQLCAASAQKYGYNMKPEDYEANPDGTYVFRPRIVFAWTESLKDITRWRLP